MIGRIHHLAVVIALLGALAAPRIVELPSAALQEEPERAQAIRWLTEYLPTEEKSDATESVLRRMSAVVAAEGPAGLEIVALKSFGSDPRATWLAGAVSVEAVGRYYEEITGSEYWVALSEELDALDVEAETIFMVPVIGGGMVGRLGFLWHRRARVDPQDLACALTFARAEVAYVNAHYPGARVQLYSGMEQWLGNLVWFADFDDADAWVQFQSKLWQDEEYLQLMEGASGLFEPNSWREFNDSEV